MGKPLDSAGAGPTGADGWSNPLPLVSLLDDPDRAVRWLRTPAAIRARCELLLAAAEADRLEHFALHAQALDATARYVADTIRRNYPSLAVPYHSRWRHFTAGGRDRWALLASDLRDVPPAERARMRIELVAISVLLDAGAGGEWSYLEAATGQRYARSEGLAVASFHLFKNGFFSSSRSEPLRVDAEALEQVEPERLAAALQVSSDNPLLGLEGRAHLLRRLGAVLRTRADVFGTPRPRLGNLYDRILARGPAGTVSAAALLGELLEVFAPIWPGPVRIAAHNLGDVGRHSAVRSGDLTDGLVPFHKLSQWLTYSLIEPLQEAGVEVSELDALTGLAEYRNGGLLIDLGVLQPRDPGALARAHSAASEFVVEWRALTVALLDRLAAACRAVLAVDACRLPLARVLEGGTWSAGRRIARERRPDGSPPVRLRSDGTVF